MDKYWGQDGLGGDAVSFPRLSNDEKTDIAAIITELKRQVDPHITGSKRVPIRTVTVRRIVNILEGLTNG